MICVLLGLNPLDRNSGGVLLHPPFLNRTFWKPAARIMKVLWEKYLHEYTWLAPGSRDAKARSTPKGIVLSALLFARRLGLFLQAVTAVILTPCPLPLHPRPSCPFPSPERVSVANFFLPRRLTAGVSTDTSTWFAGRTCAALRTALRSLLCREMHRLKRIFTASGRSVDWLHFGGLGKMAAICDDECVCPLVP